MHVVLPLLLLLLTLFLIVSETSKIESLDTMTIKHVLVPIVMEAEAKPLIEHLKLEQTDEIFPSHTPFLAYSGSHNGLKVTVITFGKDKIYGTEVDNVGTVPASLATFLALQTLDVQLVLNAGTCGGFGRKGAAIGDVFVTTGVAHHDRRIPIPGFDTYGTGALDVLPAGSMADDLNFKTGVCTTGNSLDKTDKDDELMLENDASVKDMEAASIAWTCSMNQVPYLGIKVVTDIVDGGVATQDEFLANLASAARSLQEAMPKVLDYLSEKIGDEL